MKFFRHFLAPYIVGEVAVAAIFGAPAAMMVNTIALGICAFVAVAVVALFVVAYVAGVR